MVRSSARRSASPCASSRADDTGANTRARRAIACRAPMFRARALLVQRSGYRFAIGGDFPQLARTLKPLETLVRPSCSQAIAVGVRLPRVPRRGCCSRTGRRSVTAVSVYRGRPTCFRNRPGAHTICRKRIQGRSAFRSRSREGCLSNSRDQFPFRAIHAVARSVFARSFMATWTA